MSIDNYMNLQLEQTTEISEGVEEEIGEIFIRCNNVLFVRDAIVKKGDIEENGDSNGVDKEVAMNE